MTTATVYHIGGIEDLQSMEKFDYHNYKEVGEIKDYDCEGDIAKFLWQYDRMGVNDIAKSRKGKHLIVMAEMDVYIVTVSEE